MAADWAEGMGASLRAGLAALDPDADAVLVTLVDLPDVTAEVVRRVVAAATGPGSSPARRTPARRATPSSSAATTGTASARRRPATRVRATTSPPTSAAAVECGDLATGRDVDTPARTDAG